MNAMLLDMLKESQERKWVQYGEVEAVRRHKLKDGSEQELIVINYQGSQVFCGKADFIEREVTSLNGFIQTRVPFIVKKVDGDIVQVSRIEALAKVAKQFVEHVKIGDMVKGTVTGVQDSGVVFVEVQGYPCLIPPEHWDFKRTTNLREMVPIGTVVEAKVLSVAKVGDENGPDEDDHLDYRIRLSRKELLTQEVDEVWENIDEHYRVGDLVAVKITGQATGFNSYFCELPKGISLIGNLSAPIRQKYNDYLPPGVKATGVIKYLDKTKKRGKIQIQRVEPNYANILDKHSFGIL